MTAPTDSTFPPKLTAGGSRDMLKLAIFAPWRDELWQCTNIARKAQISKLLLIVLWACGRAAVRIQTKVKSMLTCLALPVQLC